MEQLVDSHTINDTLCASGINSSGQFWGLVLSLRSLVPPALALLHHLVLDGVEVVLGLGDVGVLAQVHHLEVASRRVHEETQHL